ncbi:MAG: MBL fold metallo-hydrolase [Polyangiaceae bacterium]
MRTPTLAPATHTNAYALGEREIVLVEPATPYEDEKRAFVEWVRGLESRGRKVVALFATHHHEDHVGGLAFLARELSLPVWMHAFTAERTGIVPHRLLHDGDEIVLAGPEASSYRVLHTPGHAEGHLCLHDESSGAVVVGDMVASVGTILIAPGEGDMAVYLAQLERLSKLGAKVALPAHGDPISEPTNHFNAYITHRLAREARVESCVKSLGSHGGNLDALVALAYADTPESVWPIAKLSLEAHLLKLLAEGRAMRQGSRWMAPSGAE